MFLYPFQVDNLYTGNFEDGLTIIPEDCEIAHDNYISVNKEALLLDPEIFLDAIKKLTDGVSFAVDVYIFHTKLEALLYQNMMNEYHNIFSLLVFNTQHKEYAVCQYLFKELDSPEKGLAMQTKDMIHEIKVSLMVKDAIKRKDELPF